MDGAYLEPFVLLGGALSGWMTVMSFIVPLLGMAVGGGGGGR